MSLSERVKRAAGFDQWAVAKAGIEQMRQGVATDSAYIRGAREEWKRMLPMIDSMTEIVEYFFGLTSHECTDQELEMREKLEEALAEMEKK